MWSIYGGSAKRGTFLVPKRFFGVDTEIKKIGMPFRMAQGMARAPPPARCHFALFTVVIKKCNELID